MPESATPRPQAPGWSRFAPADFIVLALGIALLAGFFMTDVRAVAYEPPPDFGRMSVEQKKREFFAYLSPMVARVNFEMADDRRRVERLRARYESGDPIGWLDRRWLGRLAVRLEVPIEEMELGEALAMLERRAGVVPEALVLVQAAIESGWGTSRFALEGNNYFGQRCYSADCGIVPEQRADGQRFGLAEFSSVAASVESYIMNLNTHEGYREFRLLREELRDADRPVTGLAVVESLVNYSERGADYVAQLEAMIRANNLE
jgi:Bax protein